MSDKRKKKAGSPKAENPHSTVCPERENERINSGIVGIADDKIREFHSRGYYSLREGNFALRERNIYNVDYSKTGIKFCETLYLYLNSSTLYAIPSWDTITCGEDSEFVMEGCGEDVLHGGSSEGVIEPGEVSDFLLGGDGEDVLLGGSSKDVFEYGGGRDFILGGFSEDYLFVGPFEENNCIPDGEQPEVIGRDPLGKIEQNTAIGSYVDNIISPEYHVIIFKLLDNEENNSRNESFYRIDWDVQNEDKRLLDAFLEKAGITREELEGAVANPGACLRLQVIDPDMLAVASSRGRGTPKRHRSELPHPDLAPDHPKNRLDAKFQVHLDRNFLREIKEVIKERGLTHRDATTDAFRIWMGLDYK